MVFSLSFGIDELFVDDPFALYTEAAGRMSPLSAIAFSAIGLALVALPYRKLIRLARLLTVMVLLIGCVSAVGYVWNASELVTNAVITPLAVNTAVAFVVASWGILASTRLESASFSYSLRLPFNIKSKLIAGLALALMILIVGFGAFYRSFDEFDKAEVGVQQRQKVIAELTELYSDLSDMETSQRNYMITGAAAYRQQYTDDAAIIAKKINDLSSMETGNQSQSARLAALQSIIVLRLSALDQSIALYEAYGLEAARAVVLSHVGDDDMIVIRNLIFKIQDSEIQLLEHHKNAITAEREKMLVYLLLLLTVMAAVFISLLYYISKEMNLRQKRDVDVRELNSHLRLRIDERNKANAALDLKEREVSAILDNILDCVITINTNGLILSANPALLKIFGYANNEVIGKNFSMLIPEQDNQTYLERYLLKGEEQFKGISREVSGKHKDGKDVPCELSLNEYIADNEHYLVGVLRNINERKKLISDLEQARFNADKANAAKSDFLSTMSHEIRTPLNGVIANLELLGMTNVDDDQLVLLGDAQRAGMSLLGLIGNILDFSKIEQGKFVSEIQDINFIVIVEEAILVLQSTARQKGVFVASAFAPEVPVIVRGDGSRLRQILLNLIGNAIKFNDEGGVYVDVDVITQDREMCEIKLNVHDSGIGFDQAIAETLFKPFIQDQASASGREGTGLGLSICHSLLENFGGTIDCEGVPAEGATFSVMLPVTIVEHAPLVAKPDLSERSVLFICEPDDEVEKLENYFMERGARVTIYKKFDGNTGYVADAKTEYFDLAVFFTRDFKNIDINQVAALREQQITTLVYGPDASHQNYRRCLRAGGAFLFPSQSPLLSFDRNINHLMGSAPLAQPIMTPLKQQITSFSRSELRKKHVLVLEDRLINQAVIKEQLLKIGVQCTMASNGLLGLEAMEKHSFDLILCDCSMPEMNGFEFTRALRSLELDAADGRRMPIIALTANAFREDAEKCYEAGMDDFMSKPLSISRLTEVLEIWLSSDGAEKYKTTEEFQIDDEIIKGTIELPVDIDAMAAIMGIDDKSLLFEILEQFMPAAQESYSMLEAAIVDGGMVGIKAAAHGAKGEARSIAAHELGRIYDELESFANEDNAVEIKSTSLLAAAELHRIEKYIQINIADFAR